MGSKLHQIGIGICVLFLLFGLARIHSATATTINELESAIATKNTDIAKLEKEIAAYQAQLNEIGKEKQSLVGTIAALDISRKKLSADILLTENRIAKANLRISELGLEIHGKATSIATATAGLESVVRTLNEMDRSSPVETLLSGGDFGDVWNQVEAIGRFEGMLRLRLQELSTLKASLESTEAETKKQKAALVAYDIDLSNQKKALDANRKEKTALLAATKNKESNYRKILEEKVALKNQFEQELFSYQSELRIAIDPSALPRTGSGVLSWPVDQVVITQYFGNTEFATQNPQVYNGKGHNGIDLRASPGVRIKAALAGTVVGTGDTDLTCAYASYGRWVLIRHNNGLSTLYAHLSVINVTQGQSVTTGQVVGYSGSTGYATGPHLHFTVYATQGVQIAQLPSKALACRGKIYTLPIADLKAYLNPLSYL